MLHKEGAEFLFLSLHLRAKINLFSYTFPHPAEKQEHVLSPSTSGVEQSSDLRALWYVLWIVLTQFPV